ncbi:hypothetical protein Fmac_003760 [Flemingia macrophylla]|uniref:Uncharacterized protein n=1 Tax=Flemingia macrophylla TaxID=520843 RepID=A0ABD1N317_9FABA
MTYQGSVHTELLVDRHWGPEVDEICYPTEEYMGTIFSSLERSAMLKIPSC